MKDYWRNNDRFADLFNQIFFHGEDVLNPSNLTDKDTEESAVIMEREKITTISKARDLIKQYAKSVDLILVGIENQMRIHYGMPVRTMLYEALDYTKQCKELEQRHREDKDWANSDEFLSGMAVGDKIKAVVTLVIYYGEEAWDGPTCLSDMMDIPKSFQPLFNNHSIHLLQVRNANKYHFKNKDNQDFFTLLAEFYNNSGEINMDDFRQKYSERDIYWETLAALGAATNTARLVELAFENKGGHLNMCTALANLKEEGHKEGFLEGREETIRDFIGILRELGISDDIISSKIQANFHLDASDAKKYLY